MTAPIGVQLYSLRNELTQDFEGIIRRVAAMGYIGVEPYGGMTDKPQQAAQLFRELGLSVPAIHAAMATPENKNQLLDTLGAYGATIMNVPWLSPDNFKTLDGVKAVCEQLNQANALLKPHGITVGYHNHEFEPTNVFEGKNALDWMFELTDPAVTFEIDTYWVKAGNADPADVVRRFGARSPLLHIKDGEGRRGVPMVAVGEGTLDFAAIVQASAGNVKWMIVELDECATDMVEAIQKSYTYLTGKGLAHGKG